MANSPSGKKQDWYELVKFVQFSYRRMFIPGTNLTPCMVARGRQPISPNEVGLADEEEAFLTGLSLDEHNKALVKNLDTGSCDGRVQVSGAEKQGFQHVRGGAALTGRCWISEVDPGRHEPRNESRVRHPHEELSRRRPERAQRGLLHRIEREETWAVDSIAAADDSARVSHRHAQLHRIECGSACEARMDSEPQEKGRRAKQPAQLAVLAPAAGSRRPTRRRPLGSISRDSLL